MILLILNEIFDGNRKIGIFTLARMRALTYEQT